MKAKEEAKQILGLVAVPFDDEFLTFRGGDTSTHSAL
jgi:hypothetical protein